MKRKIGTTLLIFAGLFYLLSLAAALTLSTGLYTFTVVMYRVCGITAIICLFGDFIRYIGKMFALGWNDAAGESNPHYCSQCGKSLEEDASFCSGCGTKIN